MHFFSTLVALSLVVNTPHIWAQPLSNASLTIFLKKNAAVSVVRGEFESTADQDLRLAYLKRNFQVDVGLGENSFKGFTYDADTMQLQVSLPKGSLIGHTLLLNVVREKDDPNKSLDERRAVYQTNWDIGMRKYALFDIVKVEGKESSYVGENAFGVRKKVQRYVSEHWAIIPLNVSEVELNKLAVELKVQPRVASTLTKQMAWRFSGTTLIGVSEWPRSLLFKEWAVSHGVYQDATLSHPTETALSWKAAPVSLESLALVNIATGEVYQSFNFPQSNVLR